MFQLNKLWTVHRNECQFSPILFRLFMLDYFMGQVAQAASDRLKAGRPGFNPGWRRWSQFSSFLRVQIEPGVHSASDFQGVKTTEHTANHPTSSNVVAADMWTLAPTSPMGLHGL